MATYITISSSMDWKTRIGTAYVIVEQGNQPPKRYTITQERTTDAGTMLHGLTVVLGKTKMPPRIIVRTAAHLGIKPVGCNRGANIPQKDMLMQQIDAAGSRIEFEIAPASEVRGHARTDWVDLEMQGDAASRLLDSHIGSSAATTTHLDPSNWHEISVPCPCGKAVVASFWKAIRCHMWKTEQCKCGRKHTVDWLP